MKGKTSICSFPIHFTERCDWPVSIIWSVEIGVWAQWLIQWQGPGGAPTPLSPTLIFKLNGGPKGRKTFLGDRAFNYLRVSMTTWTIASVSKVSIVANTFKGSSGVCTSSIHVTIMPVIFAFINICIGSERESDKLSKGRVYP